MWSYTRHQVLVLVAALVVGGGGVGVSRWRAAHPGLAERLERFDHSPPGDAATGAARAGARHDAGHSRAGAGAPHDPGGLSPREPPLPRARTGARGGAASARAGTAPAADGGAAGAGPRASPAADVASARPAKLRAEDIAHAPAVDLNRAPPEELARLPGVGPRLAARIVEARATGPFQSPDDLRRVQGVGASRLDRLRPFVVATP